MRTLLAGLITLALVSVATVATVSSASAQACRQKCNDEEVACLKRTGNKSQCGEKAKACAATCK